MSDDRWAQAVNRMYARHGYHDMTMQALSAEGIPQEERQKAIDDSVKYAGNEIEAEALHQLALQLGVRSPFAPPPQNFQFVPGPENSR
jgi:hypothetical protein